MRKAEVCGAVAGGIMAIGMDGYRGQTPISIWGRGTDPYDIYQFGEGGQTPMTTMTMEHVINLRAHHLLCTVLFKGKGYSEQFTDEMTAIVEDLKNPLTETEIILQTSPDAICKFCPNNINNDACALDENEETAAAKINSVDEKVLEHFILPKGENLLSKEVYMKINEMITKEFFDEICKSCRWYQMGVCSYEEYKERIKLFYMNRK